MPMIVEFPDNKTERLIEDAMEELGNWVEGQIDIGLSPIILIGLMETYKSALSYNLLVDEDE
jgi:predicted transcriptional regulator